MEAKAISIIADLIATQGLPAAIRRLQDLDPDRLTVEAFAALKPCRSLADPDCHFCVDDSAFCDDGEAA